jgi:hypothetical protein
MSPVRPVLVFKYLFLSKKIVYFILIHVKGGLTG